MNWMYFSWLVPLIITVLSYVILVWKEPEGSFSTVGAFGFLGTIIIALVSWGVWAAVFITYLVMR